MDFHLNGVLCGSDHVALQRTLSLGVRSITRLTNTARRPTFVCMCARWDFVDKTLYAERGVIKPPTSCLWYGLVHGGQLLSLNKARDAGVENMMVSSSLRHAQAAATPRHRGSGVCGFRAWSVAFVREPCEEPRAACDAHERKHKARPSRS